MYMESYISVLRTYMTISAILDYIVQGKALQRSMS